MENGGPQSVQPWTAKGRFGPNDVHHQVRGWGWVWGYLIGRRGLSRGHVGEGVACHCVVMWVSGGCISIYCVQVCLLNRESEACMCVGMCVCVCVRVCACV